LVDDDQRIRIADFGLAKVVDSQATNMMVSSSKGHGNIRWQAPELFQSGDGDPVKASAESDTYAFGCVCLEVNTITITSNLNVDQTR
jgi:serine/threonine protein kinase